MDRLEKLIIEMKADIQRQFSTIEAKITTKINNNLNDKFNSLSREFKQLRLQTDEQEKRIDELEKKGVQKNLVFFGIEEGEDSYLQLQGKILNVVNENLNVDISEPQIEAVRRIGKKGGKSRPVAVTFTTLGTKIKILKNKKMLQNSDIYIKPEFPSKILKIREQLKIKQKQEEDKGNKTFLRYDKLVVSGKSEKSGNKRAPSSSPPAAENTETHRMRTINKKQRTNNHITSYYTKQSEKDVENQEYYETSA